MPSIPLGLNDWESPEEGISRIKLRNMYIADNPSSPDGKTRVSRMTTSVRGSLPQSGCRGLFTLLGTSGVGPFAVAFGVYGTTLYRIAVATGTATPLGVVPGTGICQFAGTIDRLVIVCDGFAYRVVFDAMTTVEPIVMPGTFKATSVATIYGYFIISAADGSDGNRFYWIPPGADDPDPLDFASAERYPDPIVSVSIVNDEVWFLGSDSIEVWQATGNSDAPFQRLVGRDYSDGCRSRDAVATVSANNYPALMWVTSTGAVVLGQGGTLKVSNESVEELLRTAIRNYSNLRAFGFRYNRHDFYVVTAPTEGSFTGFTLVYDLTQKTWSRWDTSGLDTWVAEFGFQIGASVYVADSFTNNFYILEEGGTDAGAYIVREVSGFVPNVGKAYPCSDVIVSTNPSTPSALMYLAMRFSDDLGQNWSDYFYVFQQDYATQIIYRSLGLIARPGRLFEFKYDGTDLFRLDYATLNEDSP